MSKLDLTPLGELAPTLDIPSPTHMKMAVARPPYTCCPCGAMVLVGVVEATGEEVVLHIKDHAKVPETRAYCPVWNSKENVYRLYESRAYVVHRCPMRGERGA